MKAHLAVVATSTTSDRSPAKTADQPAAKSSSRAAKTAKPAPKLAVRTHGSSIKPSVKAPAKVKVPSLADRPVMDLWVEYQQTHSDEIRNYFWQKYFPLVRYVAEKVYARLPAEVDVGDLVSSGQFGLADAINAFDLSKGVKFETYCVTRIRGAILDELRAMDWVPRLVRSRTAKLQNASERNFVETGRRPSNDELMALLGIEGDERGKLEKDGSAIGIVSLNRKCFSSDGSKEVTEIDVIRDDSQTDPLEDTQRRDIKDLITRGLSRAERLIVTLYYYEEMTMKEIGSTLDLSESRVSQMHSGILARLKAQMHHKARELQQQ